MKQNKADVIFHPVRIRVVQALFGGRRLTAQQLVAELGGASIATLYRHLNRLVEAGIIAIVEERPIRGTVEKVYALGHDRAASISGSELRQMSREEHLQHFSTFVGSLLADYGRYVAQEQFDTEADGVMVRQESLYLDAEESRRIGSAIREVLTSYRQNPEGSTRRRYLLTTVMLPVVETPETEAASEEQ